MDGVSRFPDLERFPVLAHAGGSCPVDAEAFVWPVYRGEENEALGVRRICGLAWQFVWQHDGEGLIANQLLGDKHGMSETERLALFIDGANLYSAGKTLGVVGLGVVAERGHDAQ